MSLLRPFNRAQLIKLCTLGVLLYAQQNHKNKEPKLFRSSYLEDNELSHQQKITQYYSRYLSKSIQPFFHEANNCLHNFGQTEKTSGYKRILQGKLWHNWLRSFVPGTSEWRLRKKYSASIYAFKQELLRELSLAIPNTSKVKTAALKYLRARYFVSWKKYLPLGFFALFFSTFFLFSVAALANFGLLNSLGALVVHPLISLYVFLETELPLILFPVAVKNTGLLMGLSFLFGICVLATLRELLDPGFYIKCFGHKQVIEFSYGFDSIELEEEYFAKRCQFDKQFTLFFKVLLSFRFLLELILRSIEFLLSRFIDFIDSFFIMNERSSLVARGCKWSIHLLFCLLMTPLQLLRPLEDLVHHALAAISMLCAFQTRKPKEPHQFTLAPIPATNGGQALSRQFKLGV